MADSVISKQELIDAQKDSEALGLFINGGETETVQTRLNKNYPTLANALHQIMEAGGFEPFTTEAALKASVPTVAKKAAKAMDTKKVWFWNGSAWVDTGLSDLDQAKNYADTSLFFKPIAIVSGNDFNNLKKDGLYKQYGNLPSGSLINAPLISGGEHVSGTCLVFNTGGGLLTQIFFPYSSSFKPLWRANNASDVWSSWDTFVMASQLPKIISLTNGQDVFGLSAGEYDIPSTAIGNTLLNMPAGVPYKFGKIFVHANGSYKFIRFVPYGRDNSFYTTAQYEGAAWQTWQKFSSLEDFNTLINLKIKNKVEGVIGKNLFDTNAYDVAIGMYPSNNSGELAPNASYNTTGFIPVVAGQSYTTSQKHYWCWYDVNKTFISGTNHADSNITQTAPAGAAFMRASCSVAGWSIFQVELGSTKTAYEAYSLNINIASIKDKSITEDKLADKSITEDKLADKSITPLKSSFMEQGKNLFNIGVSDNVLNKYVNYTNGVLADNTLYNTTGFILINPSKTYTLSYIYMRAFYDANKVFISGNVGSSATFTPPPGAVYARFTVEKTKWDTFQVEVGTTATSFEKYGFKFTPDVILNQSTAYAPSIVLPPKIYALAGLQSHIYPEHLLIEDHKQYEHDISCTLGQHRIRGWEWDVPAGQAALSTSISWALYDKQQGKLITSASSTLVVANPAASTAKKVCVIGDSLVNAGVITQRLVDIAATDPMALTLIGSKGSALNKHEGRGGWTIKDYTDAGRVFYKLTVSGVTTPPALNAARYTTDGTNNLLVQEVDLSGGNGTIIFELYSGSAPTGSGTLTKINTSAGDASISFSAVQSIPGNPFWNTTTSAVDFANYLTRYSLATPDVVLIQLGVNDTFGLSSDADVETFTVTAFNNLDTLITSIKAANTNAKVGVVASPNYANQDAFGTNYACGQTSWRAKRNIVTFNKKLYEYYKGKETQNIYVIGSGVNVDTEYNVQTTTRAVNSQNSTIVTVQNNGVHPDTTGYKQIGDALFAFLKSI